MKLGNPKYFHGVLESAGLGEVGYYLKKAKTNLGYAEYTLNSTDFSEITDRARDLKKKIANLHNTIVEIDVEIDRVMADMATAIEEVKESEEEENNESD